MSRTHVAAAYDSFVALRVASVDEGEVSFVKLSHRRHKSARAEMDKCGELSFGSILPIPRTRPSQAEVLSIVGTPRLYGLQEEI